MCGAEGTGYRASEAGVNGGRLTQGKGATDSGPEQSRVGAEGGQTGTSGVNISQMIYES